MAVVEGTVLTRRRMIRAVGPRTETQEEDEYEASLRRKLVQRATDLILVKAAERDGLKIPPELLDNAVRTHSRREVEQASKTAGRPVTLDEVLRFRNLTFAEYRESLGHRIVIQEYFNALWKGVPGKRAKYDLEASPAEIRRIYERHAAVFDLKPSARIAFWIARPVDLLEGSKRTYDEAVAETTRRLEDVLARVAAGKTPEQIAKELALPADGWLSPPRDFERADFVEIFQRLDLVRPADVAADWIFDPARKPREGRVFEGTRGSLVAIGVLQAKPGRKRSFSDPDVQDDIAKAVREIRRQRAINQHLLQLLATASIHPPILAEQIGASVRADLKKLDDDPFNRTVWLR
jgi:hypothetical protein